MTMLTFLKQLLPAARALAVLTVLLGVAYPLGMTAVGLLLPHQAGGSLIEVDGTPVGSALLGQAADDPRWFQARPSVSGHAGDVSGGSNWGPSAPDLAAELAEREAALREANPDAPAGPIPADALTASASGLDPHISPAYARWQAPRVAAAWDLDPQLVEQLIADHTDGAPLGFLGTEVVNATTLNVALAAAGRVQ